MKLILADDHTLFRDALVQYIKRAEPQAKVDTASDLDDVRKILSKSANHDLVLLDLKMPGMNGLNGFRIMRESYPDLPVAIISGIAEKSDIFKALEYGVAGYFPKTLSGKALLEGIKQVVDTGEVFIPMDAQSKSILPSYYSTNDANTSVAEKASADDYDLTQREMDVLRLLIEGKTNKDIADSLGLQVVTIKLHVRGICRKLGADNRTQAAIRARDLGLSV